MAMRGSVWTFLGYASNQGLRLVSNLVLTRLLFPEVFGLMTLLMTFIQGLQMFSDVGIGPSIIQSNRGDDETYLSTAWTIQCLRGGALLLVSIAAGWPMALAYGRPELAVLVPVAGITALIQGFNATTIFTCRRHMRLGRVTALETLSQVAASVTTIAIAIVYPNVWSLLVGTIVGNIVRLVGSHRWLPLAFRHRFSWDAASRHALFEFGRWITLSSAVYFLARQGDRFLLGRDMAFLGVYGIAVYLAESVENVMVELSHSVLYPALSRVGRESPERIRGVYYKARLRLDALFLPMCGILAIAGTWVVHFLYKGPFWGAGWILQFMAVRVAMSCLATPAETCLVALGRPRYGFVRSAVKCAWVVAGVPLAWWWGGVSAVVFVMAATELPAMVALWPAVMRYRLFELRRECAAALLFAGGALLGLAFVAIAPAWSLSAIVHTIFHTKG